MDLNSDATAEQYEAHKVLAPRLTRAARDLRQQADRLDRLAETVTTPSPAREGTLYSQLAGGALSDLMNTLANLNLGGIVSSAGQADAYRAKGV